MAKQQGNSTEFSTYIRKHRDDFRNAAAVRDCKGAVAIDSRGNAPCMRCGFPTVEVSK